MKTISKPFLGVGSSTCEFKLKKRNNGSIENPLYEYAWFREDGQQVSNCFTEKELSIDIFKKIPYYLKFIPTFEIDDTWILCSLDE